MMRYPKPEDFDSDCTVVATVSIFQWIGLGIKE